MRPWILSEANYGYIKENPYDVAVLPMGATEPHNLHLPYGTDHYEAEDIGSRVCEAAYKQGAKVVLLLVQADADAGTLRSEFGDVSVVLGETSSERSGEETTSRASAQASLVECG